MHLGLSKKIMNENVIGHGFERKYEPHFFSVELTNVHKFMRNIINILKLLLISHSSLTCQTDETRKQEE